MKGGSGEALRTVDIGITFGEVAILNTTPERINESLESVIPYTFILVDDSFIYIDGLTFCEVIVEHWGGTVT